MQAQPYPTTPTSQPASTAPSPPTPAMRVLHGLWVASCGSCGFQLASARTQDRCERRARRRVCPVCHQDGY